MSIALQHAIRHLAGFNVIDCDVRDSSFIYLLAREDYTQRAGWSDGRDPPAEAKLIKRAVSLNLKNDNAKKWGSMSLKGLQRSMCAMAFAPERKLLVIDNDSVAWAHNPNTDGFEPEIEPMYLGGPLRGAVLKARGFGEEVICSSNGRDLLIRRSLGKWERVGLEIPYTYTSETVGDFGFSDFEVSPSADLYAVGGLSDVWRFDGQRWSQCAFPTNTGPSSVCCTPNGVVYIAAGAGSVYRGSGDRWKLIHEGNYTLPFQDMVWYENKVWCTSDYGLWTIEGDTLTEADVPSAVKVCSGNLATRDGVLLVAGYGGAAYKRDGEWTVIFHDHELRELAAQSK